MLEHLLGDGVRRKAKKALANGEAARATIVGIHVRPRGEPETDRWEYALDVQPAGAASFRAGVRQQLVPQRERAHIGASVTVRYLKPEEVVIDWSASMDSWSVPGVSPSAGNWKAVDPPADGIEDRRKPFRPPTDGEPVTAELISVARSRGPFSGWDLSVRVAGEERQEPRVQVPAYAVHRLVPGASLPAKVGRKRLVFDWQRDGGAPGPTRFDFDAMLPAPPPPDEVIEDVEAWMAERQSR